MMVLKLIISITIRTILFSSLLVACSRVTIEPVNALSWRLDQAELYESKISVYQSDEKLATYTISCNLSDAVASELSNENTPEGEAEQPTVDIVQIKAHRKGVLVVRCIIGAHSQMVEVYDPFSTEEEAFYSRSGSYFADWQLRDQELWVRYDQRCSEDAETECENTFLELEEKVQ